MAMQKVSQGNQDETKVKLEKEGEALEGNYLGAETFTHKNKPVTKHRFKSSDGKTLSILGGYVLNTDLQKVPQGAFTRITFLGKRPTKNGNTVSVYDIEFDPEQVGL